jgi:hypothetical protein
MMTITTGTIIGIIMMTAIGTVGIGTAGIEIATVAGKGGRF